MICEDVGEFDSNVVPPQDPPVPVTTPRPMVPENPMPAAEEKLEVIKRTGALTYDPISKLISRLTPIYREKIEPLISLDTTYGDPAECARRVTSVREAAFDTANMLRACIVKYAAVADLVSGSELCHDIMAPCAKMIITGNADIQSEIRYTFDTIPGLCYSSEVMGLISVIIGTPAMQEMDISQARLERMLGHNHDFSDTFGGIDDFLSAVFDEPGKLVSLYKKETVGMLMDALILPPKPKCLPSDLDPDKELQCHTLKFISCTLRDISMRCYDLWCAITEKTASADVYSYVITALSRRTINMFAVGTMVAFFYASLISKEVFAIEATMVARDKIMAANSAATAPDPVPPDTASEGGTANG